MLPGRLQWLCKSCWCSMIWSKAAARKTLYQFPDARCHLRHQQCLDGLVVWGPVVWIFSGILPDHQLKTYSEQLQNKHQNTSNLRSGLFSRNIQDLNHLRDASNTLQRMNKPNGTIEKQGNHQMNQPSTTINNHQKSSNESSFTFKIGWKQPSTTFTTVFRQFAAPCSSNSGQVSTYGGVE